METATSEQSFLVRTESYEGPFDVLLDLIEKHKLSINELSLAQITEEYIAFIKSHEAFPMEDAIDFIQVAATLLLIKSKSLIPELELSSEEETDVEDLKHRLSVYEQTRNASRELSLLFGRHVMVSAGERAPEPVFSPSRDLTLDAIERALHETLASREKEEKLPEHRVRPTITLEEMMDTLAKRVQSKLTLSFKEFSGDIKDRVEVIVSFLALLELVKQGAVDTYQHEHFADIRITTTNAGTPRYE